MKDGVCFASQERMAKELGLSLRTVHEHLKTLTEAGYIQKHSEIGLPNTYKDTGIIKAEISIRFSEDTQEMRKGYADNSQVGTQEMRTKIQEKKQENIPLQKEKDLEEFEAYQKNKLSQKQLSNATKQVHDMVEHSKKAEKNKHQELPEQLIPLAKLFMDKTGIAYLPSQRTFWISSLQEWQTIGVTAEDIELAVDRMGGYVINSPKSLTTILNGLVAERKRDVDNDPRSKYTLVTED
jgi:DNA-binding transcriptional MocR family regulator